MERFTPTTTFYSEELGSEYCQGLVYTIRPGADKLARLVHEQWLPAGRVSLVTAAAAEIKGSASVPVGKKSLWERITSWL